MLIKRALIGLVVLFALLFTVTVTYAALRTMSSATGTLTKNSSSILSFATIPRNNVIINNTTAAAVYFKVNADNINTTASATVYDVVLAQNGSMVLPLPEKYPVRTLGVFCASTTPTVKAVGW